MNRIIKSMELKLIVCVFAFGVIFSVNAFAALSESAALDLNELNKMRRLRDDIRSTNITSQSIIRVHKPVKIVTLARLPKVSTLPVLAAYHGSVTGNAEAKPLNEVSSQSNRMIPRAEKTSPRLQTFINSLFKGPARSQKSGSVTSEPPSE